MTRTIANNKRTLGDHKEKDPAITKRNRKRKDEKRKDLGSLVENKTNWKILKNEKYSSIVIIIEIKLSFGMIVFERFLYKFIFIC